MEASGRLYSQGKNTQYPLERGLGGPQSWSGHGVEERNSQPMPGIEPWSSDRPAWNEIHFLIQLLVEASLWCDNSNAVLSVKEKYLLWNFELPYEGKDYTLETVGLEPVNVWKNLKISYLHKVWIGWRIVIISSLTVERFYKILSFSAHFWLG
jgi:hypothetical protein